MTHKTQICHIRLGFLFPTYTSRLEVKSTAGTTAYRITIQELNKHFDKSPGGVAFIYAALCTSLTRSLSVSYGRAAGTLMYRKKGDQVKKYSEKHLLPVSESIHAVFTVASDWGPGKVVIMGRHLLVIPVGRRSGFRVLHVVCVCVCVCEGRHAHLYTGTHELMR